MSRDYNQSAWVDKRGIGARFLAEAKTFFSAEFPA